MVETNHSKRQRLGFAALLTLGAVKCFVGAFCFWVSGKITFNDGVDLAGSSISIPFVGDEALVAVEAGLFLRCYKVLDEADCEIEGYLESKDDELKVWRCLILAVNLKVALFCSIAAWCRFCCAKESRIIFYSIASFVSGAAGMITVGWFVNVNSGMLEWKIVEPEYDWGFYLYAIGSGILIVASVVPYFLASKTPMVQMGATSGNINVQQQNQMTNIAGGPVPQVGPPAVGYAPMPAPHSDPGPWSVNVSDTQPLWTSGPGPVAGQEFIA